MKYKKKKHTFIEFMNLQMWEDEVIEIRYK